MTVISFAIFFVAFQLPQSLAWDYGHQGDWPGTCQTGKEQSPIDLVTSEAIPIDGESFVFQNWNSPSETTTIENDGHSIKVNIKSNEPLTVSGGGLSGTYVLEQFHFHWGSEHTIGGSRMALEAHFVTYNSQFGGIVEALNYRDGLAVLGVLYELSSEPNKELNILLEHIGELKNPKSTAKISIRPADFLPDDLTQFYRYLGSLTTPSCNEAVVWTIFSSNFEHVSRDQINKFSSINSGHGPIRENYRDVQALNERRVYAFSTS